MDLLRIFSRQFRSNNILKKRMTMREINKSDSITGIRNKKLRAYIELIQKVKGWENLTDEEALVKNNEFDRFVQILIAGLPPDRLNKAIAEIEKKKLENRQVNPR